MVMVSQQVGALQSGTSAAHAASCSCGELRSGLRGPESKGGGMAHHAVCHPLPASVEAVWNALTRAHARCPPLGWGIRIGGSS